MKPAKYVLITPVWDYRVSVLGKQGYYVTYINRGICIPLFDRSIWDREDAEDFAKTYAREHKLDVFWGNLPSGVPEPEEQYCPCCNRVLED